MASHSTEGYRIRKKSPKDLSKVQCDALFHMILQKLSWPNLRPPLSSAKGKRLLSHDLAASEGVTGSVAVWRVRGASCTYHLLLFSSLSLSQRCAEFKNRKVSVN